MPRYIYKCTVCDHKEIVPLAISFDPKINLSCDICSDLTMTRRIGRPSFPKNCNMVRAGDWYKKTYGHELGAGSLEKAQQKEDRETLEREFRKRTRE